MKIKSKLAFLLKEYRKSQLVYIALSVAILSAFFVRIYRINELLGFYYDQGRDALVIWDLWHKGKFFLIGPTTGIEGIFRGPWYYWLIAPFYLFGQGNPVWPSVFLSFSTVLALIFLFLLAKEIVGFSAGLLAVIIAGFSCQFVNSSRWLSNPTPMFLISMVFVWSLFKILKRKPWALVLASFTMGMAIQFGSAAEIFYIPAFLLFAYWQRKKIANKNILFISAFAFFSVFLPQIVFDFRHSGVLSSAITRFLFEEGSFKLSFWEIVQVRIPFYYNLFSSLLWSGGKVPIVAFLAVALFGLIIKWKKIWNNHAFRIVLILFISPLLGMLFFQGNDGNIYNYYFTGYYLIFVLIFSVLLTQFSNTKIGKFTVGLFVISFLVTNYFSLRKYLSLDLNSPKAIVLANEIRAVNWVYEEVNGQPFNVDVYVPPVIPYAYDYLFKWTGNRSYGYEPEEGQVPILYTIYENDFYTPKRLEDWLIRQDTIASIEKEVVFGGITVQRRIRYAKD